MNKPESFPEGLLEALADASINLIPSTDESTIQARLKAQMQADALQPLSSDRDENGEPNAPLKEAPISPEIVEEATHFLRLSVRRDVLLFVVWVMETHRQKKLTYLVVAVTRTTGARGGISAERVLVLLLVRYTIREYGGDGGAVSGSRRGTTRLIVSTYCNRLEGHWTTCQTT